MTNEVAIKKLNNYNLTDVENTLTELFDLLDANKFFKPNIKVLIKINAGVDANPDMAQTTHPAVVQGLANILSRLGAKCVVADSPLKQYSQNGLDKIYFETGLLEVANSCKCTLNRDLATFKSEIASGVKTKSAILLDVVNQVDVIINVGKLKIDNDLGMLGVSAGLFGFVPGDMKQLVLNRLTTIEDFNNYIIDLAQNLQNKILLNIFDGVVALEANNSQRMLSCLAISENMFSLDAVVSKIIGKDINDTIVKTAANRGLVELDNPCKILGDDIKNLCLQDFDFGEKINNSNIHKSKSQQKIFFNHNQQRITIEPKKCKGCSRCANICPIKAITMKYDKNGELFAKVDYSKCIFCNKCFTACPYNVIDLKTPIGYKMLTKTLEKFNEKD